jgi:hypothetical protein
VIRITSKKLRIDCVKTAELSRISVVFSLFCGSIPNLVEQTAFIKPGLHY